jgi:hypothetical protein
VILDRKPLIYVWRPIYRGLFEGLIWPFLDRVKSFFFAEASSELTEVRNRLTALEATTQNRLTGLEAAVHDLSPALEAATRNRLTALETAVHDLSPALEAATRNQLTALEAAVHDLHSALEAATRESNASRNNMLTEQQQQWRATRALLLSLFSNSQLSASEKNPAQQDSLANANAAAAHTRTMQAQRASAQ